MRGKFSLSILLFCLLVVGGCGKRHLTTVTMQMDAEEQFWIRVLLLGNVRTCSLKINSGFTVLDSETQRYQARFEQGGIGLDVKISGGRIAVAGQLFDSNEVTIFPDDPHVFDLNGNEYRGKLKLVANFDSNSFDAINLVPLEPYLAGVIGAEMPNYWELAALRAQVIAARTYCLYIKKRFGSGRSWDMRKTQSHQVYRGVKVESSQIWNAVNKTRGQVLICKDAQEESSYARRQIFPAYYSSMCGGHTENSTHVFGGKAWESLVGVRCPYCRGTAKLGFFFWSMVEFNKADVGPRIFRKYPKLKELGDINDISPSRQSDYDGFSRLTMVRLTGSTGKTGLLRAEDLRLTIDPSGFKLKSTICEIMSQPKKWVFLSGRGFGHGVGMCQYGVEGLARKGEKTKEILAYYYPSSKIKNIY